MNVFRRYSETLSNLGRGAMGYFRAAFGIDKISRVEYTEDILRSVDIVYMIISSIVVLFVLRSAV